MELIGDTNNLNGVGAELRFSTLNGTYYRMNDGIDFLGQSIQPVHVGLGSATMVNELLVTWPDGAMEIFQNVEVNQTFVVQEGTGIIVSTDPGPPNSTSGISLAAYPNPVGSRVSIQFTAPSSGVFLVEVYSILGKRVVTEQLRVTVGEIARFELSMDDMPSGLYLYQITKPSSAHVGSGTFNRLR